MLVVLVTPSHTDLAVIIFRHPQHVLVALYLVQLYKRFAHRSYDKTSEVKSVVYAQNLPTQITFSSTLMQAAGSISLVYYSAVVTAWLTNAFTVHRLAIQYCMCV